MSKKRKINYSTRKLNTLKKALNSANETIELLNNPKNFDRLTESIKQYNTNRLLSIKGFENA
ncbi:hypothetical protein [Cetobacterium sp.]|uniref:hypothetical protein n=1 Tax=Cetobacterium sp. TaxID=2071632 RepID=UPI003F2A60AA